MAVERIERKGIDVGRRVTSFQETTCRTHVLDNEMTYSGRYFSIIRRQYTVVRRVAQRNGYQIKRGFEHNEKYFGKGFQR